MRHVFFNFQGNAVLAVLAFLGSGFAGFLAVVTALARIDRRSGRSADACSCARRVLRDPTHIRSAREGAGPALAHHGIRLDHPAADRTREQSSARQDELPVGLNLLAAARRRWKRARGGVLGYSILRSAFAVPIRPVARSRTLTTIRWLPLRVSR